MAADAFFFQAEDGIRGGHVTGVQTCALPISTDLPAPAPQIVGAAATDRARPTRGGSSPAARAAALTRSPDEEHPEPEPDLEEQIGRASCRERVEISEVGGALKKKRT